MLAAIVLLAESFATTVAFWTFPFSVKDVLFNAIDLTFRMADIGITFTLQVQFNIIKKVKNFVRITLREIKELIVKIKLSKIRGGKTMNQPKILVVDDDKEIVGAIKKRLEMEDYEIITAYNGLEAMDVLMEQEVQLLIIDVMMPKMDGLSATMKIRESKNIPIIILSAKTEESDKILGLSMGADDYVSKPFRPDELVARVKSQLRRYMQFGGMNAPKSNKEQIINGGLILDMKGKRMLVDGEAVKLTATEYKIVSLLMKNLGRVFSADEIYERVWNEEAYATENTVMVHIRRIREKIEIDAKNPRYLKVVWGIGYKIEKMD